MDDTQELARRLVAHFTFEAGDVPPGFSGFRAKEGLSLAEFRGLLQHPTFAAAVEEARARYLDTLTAGALLKKYDTAFVRHLREEAALAEDEGERPPFAVEIRVVSDEA